MPGRRYGHKSCICVVFLQCEFSNVPSDSLPKQRNSHIGCTCVIFLRSDFSNVLLICLRQWSHWSHSQIGCISLSLLFSCLSFYCSEFQREWIGLDLVAGIVFPLAHSFPYQAHCFAVRLVIPDNNPAQGYNCRESIIMDNPIQRLKISFIKMKVRAGQLLLS